MAANAWSQALELVEAMRAFHLGEVSAAPPEPWPSEPLDVLLAAARIVRNGDGASPAELLAAATTPVLEDSLILVYHLANGGRLRRVVLESPYSGNRKLHKTYARAALLDSLRRGEAPLATHLLYTQVLDDDVPGHRTLGIAAGLEGWAPTAEATVAYVDLGTSAGMHEGLAAAQRDGRLVEERTLGGDWLTVHQLGLAVDVHGDVLIELDADARPVWSCCTRRLVDGHEPGCIYRGGRPPTCNAVNPWDPAERCDLAAGHEGSSHSILDPIGYWPRDLHVNCVDRCSHPKRRGDCSTRCRRVEIERLIEQLAAGKVEQLAAWPLGRIKTTVRVLGWYHDDREVAVAWPGIGHLRISVEDCYP